MFVPRSASRPTLRILNAAAVSLGRCRANKTIAIQPIMSKRQFHAGPSFAYAANGNSNGSILETSTLDLEADFHKVTDQTLERLSDFLTPLEEDDEVELEVSMGVLKLRLLSPPTSSFAKLRGQHISWVINKQTPNRQLWWSSPISGPRRYEWQPSSSAPMKDGLQIVSNWKYTRAAAIPGATNGNSNGGGANGAKAAGGKEEFDLLHQLHSEVLAVTGINLFEPK